MATTRLEGKRAVITGAAGGIAIATAIEFTRQGAAVALTDLDQTGVEKTEAKVVSQGGKAKAFVVDVTSREAVESLMSDASTFMGGIDILVTCAGGYKAYGSFEDIQEADWDQVINVNLKGVYLCCKAVLPYMKKKGLGTHHQPGISGRPQHQRRYLACPLCVGQGSRVHDDPVSRQRRGALWHHCQYDCPGNHHDRAGKELTDP